MAVHGGCGGEMGVEGVIVTGRVPSIPAQSPHVLLAPETNKQPVGSPKSQQNTVKMWPVDWINP